MRKLFLSLVFASLFTVCASAQVAPVLLQSVRVVPPMLTTARHTGFKPAVHGFAFANTFANNMVSEIDIRTDGLCGGMVYAALDYFYNHMPIPKQRYEPTEGTALRTHIYDRQVKSLAGEIDKWGELAVNPFGTRNAEFYRWGLDGKPGGRIDELRRQIDAGKPVPLGLLGCNEGCKGDHQVLAIGYDMGGYKGDFAEDLRKFKIFVYDPNHPGRTMTLVAFPEADQFRYAEDHSNRWRTYFVGAKYRMQKPPVIGDNAREMIVLIGTGGDDLRGGNDILTIEALLKDGGVLRFENVNKSRRWVNNSTQSVALPLSGTTMIDDIRGLRFVTSLGGGMGGDNWNLDSVLVQELSATGERTLFSAAAAPLFRFTGDQKNRDFIF